MVGSELTGGVSIGDLLVFLGCWRLGPYADPDQQGDTVDIPMSNIVLTVDTRAHYATGHSSEWD